MERACLSRCSVARTRELSFFIGSMKGGYLGNPEAMIIGGRGVKERKINETFVHGDGDGDALLFNVHVPKTQELQREQVTGCVQYLYLATNDE